jgi:hypothetical protein
MQADDWKQDAKGNYVFDPTLTAKNASSKLEEGEKYLGTSVTITVVDKEGDEGGKIELNKDGTVTGSGSYVEQGNLSWNHNGGAVEVDANFASGAKIYGLDQNYVNSNNPVLDLNSMDKVFAFTGNSMNVWLVSKPGESGWQKIKGGANAMRDYLKENWKKHGTPEKNRKDFMQPSGVDR